MVLPRTSRMSLCRGVRAVSLRVPYFRLHQTEWLGCDREYKLALEKAPIQTVRHSSRDWVTKCCNDSQSLSMGKVRLYYACRRDRKQNKSSPLVQSSLKIKVYQTDSDIDYEPVQDITEAVSFTELESNNESQF